MFRTSLPGDFPSRCLWLNQCVFLLALVYRPWITALGMPHTAATVCTNQGEPFNETVIAPGFASGVLQVPSLRNKSSSFHCRILLGTRSKGFRIRLTFNATLRPSPNFSCDTDYIHVGNSRYTIDMKTMTSYKFCGGTNLQEVVSRGQVLWVVLRSMSEGYFSGLNFHYDILPNDPCDNGSYFRCSPVECIRSDFRCDGQIHCSNARDEYCDRMMSTQTSLCSSTDSPGALETHLCLTLPPSLHRGAECFLCEDGTCIRPTLPIYHFNHGKAWWWLCDKFSHCPDGTDERMDVCLTMQSRTASLYYCPPSTNWSQLTELRAVTWQRFVCDSVAHCHGGEDELEARCFRGKEAFTLNAKIAIPVAAFFVFTTFTALLYHRDKFGVKACHSVTSQSSSNMPDSNGRQEQASHYSNNEAEAIPSTSKDQSHPNYFILSQTAV